MLAELRRQKLQIRIKQLEALIDRHGLVLAGTHELSLTIFMQLRRHLVEGDSSKDRHRQQQDTKRTTIRCATLLPKNVGRIFVVSIIF